jgi:hypothetical protein
MKLDDKDSPKIGGQRFIGFRFIVLTGMVLLSIMVVTGIEAWSFSDLSIHHSKIYSSSEKIAVARTRGDFMAIASALIGAGPLVSDAKRANAA